MVPGVGVAAVTQVTLRAHCHTWTGFKCSASNWAQEGRAQGRAARILLPPPGSPPRKAFLSWCPVKDNGGSEGGRVPVTRRLSPCRARAAWPFQGQGKFWVRRSGNLCQWRPRTGVNGRTFQKPQHRGAGPSLWGSSPWLSVPATSGPSRGLLSWRARLPLTWPSSPHLLLSNLISQAASPSHLGGPPSPGGAPSV